MGADFIAAIRDTLGHAPDVTPPGALVRFPTSDRRGDKSGYARLFDDGGGGIYGCWRSGNSGTWQAWTPATPEDRKAFAERVEKARKEAARLEEASRAECRKRAATIWRQATPAPEDHPYLLAKGIRAHGLRVSRGNLVVPVKDSSGVLHGLQFIDADGGKKFLSGTAKKGCFFLLPKTTGGGKIAVCEGFATGASIAEATGHTVAVAFDAGNLRHVAEALHEKAPSAQIVVAADDDHATPGNPGLAKGTEAARAVGGLLAVPDFSGTERTAKASDFNDLARLKGLDAVRACIEGTAEPLPYPAPAGDRPAQSQQESPLLFDEIHTPDLSPDLLPGWLGEYADAVARHTQTPPAMAVLLALAAVATCAAKRFEVAPNGDGYAEPLNLWTATALPPANRKTAVISAMTAPHATWEREEAERLAPEIKRAAIKRRTLEKRRDKLEKEAANTEDKIQRECLLRDIERLEAEIPEELHSPRLWTGDTTPERLQMLLAEHGERMAVLTDEGGIFEIMAGLYNDGRANLDVFLQAHAGRAVRVDRQSRTAHLDAPALTFGLAIQPAILADMGSGGKRRFRGNGTLARFLYAVPRSNIGTRNVRANHPIPATVATRYQAGIFALLAVPPQMIDGQEVPRCLSLTAEALDYWHAFAHMIESRQGEGGDLESIQDWSGKLPGAALRIAGNFHLVEHGGNPPAQIEAATIERALDLCALLIDHAKAAFDMMEADPATADARAICKWIVAEKLCRFKKAELWARFKGRFTGKSGRLDKAMKELQARHIVEPSSEQTAGRAAMLFSVNPAMWGEC